MIWALVYLGGLLVIGLIGGGIAFAATLTNGREKPNGVRS